MLATLITKEVRHAMLTFRFAVAFILITLLILASFWVQSDSYIIKRNNYLVESEDSAARDREVTLPSQISPSIYKQPSPLSVFSVGEDLRFGASVRLWRWQVPREASGPFTNNNYLASLQPFDLMTIITLVISLFGIMLGFDAVSGEREQGTLRLQCTTPVSRGTVFSAKFIGNSIVLLIPIVFSFITGLLLLLVVKDISFTGPQWSAIGLMAAGAAIYGMVFIALGLLCSVLVRQSSLSLLLGLITWLVLTVVIPVFAQSIAQSFVPVASPTEFNNVEQASLSEAEQAYREFAKKHPDHPWGYYTGSYGPGSGYAQTTIKLDGSPVQFDQAIQYIQFMEPYMIRRSQRVWDAYQKILVSQQQQAEVASTLSIFSPVEQLRKVYTGLAGTDYSSYARFMEMARRYHGQLIDHFQNKGYFSSNALSFFSRRTPEEITEERFQQRIQQYRAGTLTLSTEEWEPLSGSNLPLFSYELPEPPLMQSLEAVVVLILLTLVLFGTGFVIFIKYDIR